MPESPSSASSNHRTAVVVLLTESDTFITSWSERARQCQVNGLEVDVRTFPGVGQVRAAIGTGPSSLMLAQIVLMIVGPGIVGSVALVSSLREQGFNGPIIAAEAFGSSVGRWKELRCTITTMRGALDQIGELLPPSIAARLTGPE